VTDFIPFALPDIGDAEIEAVVSTLRSGWLTTGPNAAALEREFVEAMHPSAHVGAAQVQAVAVNSATAGLHLALEALGVGPGDEVLVPTWTFTATAEVVRYLGATPVLVDVHPDTLNIDLARAAEAVTPRTKAIMPVHFAGLPVPRGALADFAAAHGLRVIEDAAHSHPVDSEGMPVGLGTSDAVVFSFYATKTMTSGEGGMVVSADPQLIARMRTMRLHGISRDVFNRYTSTAPSWHYEVVAPGFKYNLTDVAASMARVQLTRSVAMRERRSAIADHYDSALAGLPCGFRPVRPPEPSMPGTCMRSGSPMMRPWGGTTSSSGCRTRASAARCTSSRSTTTPTGETSVALTPRLCRWLTRSLLGR
jgi:dTDP-4-amino-4,6-dideoxygalactose transaminase